MIKVVFGASCNYNSPMDKLISDFLNTDLQYIKGVGSVLAARLYSLFSDLPWASQKIENKEQSAKSKAQINSNAASSQSPAPGSLNGTAVGRRVLDFLLNPPRAVRARNITDSVVNAQVGDDITIVLRIVSHNPGGARFSKYGKKFTKPAQISCVDKFGADVKIQFFNTKFFEYWTGKMPIGEWRVVSGRLEFSGGAVINHPDFIETIEDAGKIPAVQPIYSLGEGLTQKTMVNIRDRIFEKLAEPTGNEFIENLRTAHYPDCAEDTVPTASARMRLAYCELLAQQCAIAMTRKKRQASSVKRETEERSDVALHITHYVSRFYELLPFQLTSAQQRVVDEIKSDMQKPAPMMRLVQGDVGSGKTIVALIALLDATDAGGQGVLLAPTDTLAQQHHAQIKPLCDKLGIICEILTGRDKGKARNEKLISLRSGRTKIAIGTHALFQEDVEYKNLTLAVIDEQHRFGVAQRAAMASKGKFVDILALSATPIPRTLSMTMYGDMDISIIDQKPAGRVPVKTTVLPAARAGTLVSRINAQIQSSLDSVHSPVKVFWVCPLVEESETSDLMAVEARYEFLKNAVTLHKTSDDACPAPLGGGMCQSRSATVGLVHGKMPKEERDCVMAKFADPNSDMRVLVSTTVIEVGIDVPSATIMVIENAERFGLSALHQLRGRVGRGDAQSFCVLLYGDNITADGKKRLDILTETDDGFAIAEQDLMMRGVGELLGTKQSGWIKYHFVDYREHRDIFKLAQRDAMELFRTDPALISDKGRFARNMMQIFDQQTSMGN